MNKDLQDFKEFMKQREEASQAFVNGDVEPLEKLSTHVSPATIFGSQGDCIEGAKEVNLVEKSEKEDGYVPKFTYRSQRISLGILMDIKNLATRP